MPHKIKPYISRKLSIKSPSQYLAFMKNKPKILASLILNGYDYVMKSPPTARELLKIAKRVKYVRGLRIYGFDYLKLHRKPLKMLDFIKRISKIKILSLHNSHNNYSPFSYLWPKYIKNLKALSFDTPYSGYTSFLDFSESHPFDYVETRHLNKIRSIRFISKYQNRLRDLEICFSSDFVDFQAPENLDLQFYCPSLRKLTLRDGYFVSLAPSTTFDNFKNLKALELSFGMRTSPEFLSSILCLLPKIPNLESLSFMILDKDSPGLEDRFRSMARLKNVRIYSCNLALSHSKALLKILENFSLKSLDLSVSTKNFKQVRLILNLLERLTRLETLKLDISHHNNVLEPSTIEKIFQKVDNLHFLKHLSLKIDNKSSENQGETTIELPFSKLFTKSISIQTFRIVCKQVQICHQTFFHLLKSLKKRALNIKNLKLEIGEIILDEKEFQKFLDLLKNFSEIRVLELPMIGIHKKGYIMELADIVRTLKNLRSLGVGEFYASVVGIEFIQGVEKILSKHGLVNFECSLSEDFKEKTRNKDFAIDWEKVRKLNPNFSHASYDLKNLFPDRAKGFQWPTQY